MAALSMNQKVASLQTDIKNLNDKKAKYNAILAQMKKLENKRKKLAAKIDVIKQLKSKSQVTVRLLDEIANSTPGDSIWLQSLKQSGKNVSLTGIALDNTRLANYMNTLTASPYFSTAKLGKSAMVDISGQKLKSFSLNLSVQEVKRELLDSKQGIKK
ncbi:MAG: PilN domain-containing protein [Desulfobulbaceae bacterium]|nr:PilN domain-containing protein [Desulfobulbaceae bacterium]